MKITRKQLRRIIKEEISRLSSQYVVIGNAGRGRQNLWPKSEEPRAFTKAEADKIAQDLNNKQGRGYMQIHYHVKSLDVASKYISPGQPAHVGITKLIDEYGA